MPTYRMTLRFGAPRHQYDVIDIDAPSLRAALRQAADQFPDGADATADLLEVRRLVDPDERS